MASASRLASEDSEDEPEQLQYKVILLGDGATGKTSIAMRFTDDHFAQQYKQTIGVDFFMKRLLLPGNVNVALQVWDIGGQTIGGKMIGNYIFGAQAVLLCYDITNYQSFQNLEDWYNLVQRTFKGQQMPRITLVGNKTDLNHLRCVKVEKHNQFADENEMFSCFMSAKTGDNVATCFHRIAAVQPRMHARVARAIARACLPQPLRGSIWGWEGASWALWVGHVAESDACFVLRCSQAAARRDAALTVRLTTNHELDAAVPQDLAGVVLTKPELEVTSKVVRAEIVNYPQNNPEDPPHVPPTSKSGSSCLVQ